MKKTSLFPAAGTGGIILLILALGGCGNRLGPIPKNQAGTQSVIIPGYSASATASSVAENRAIPDLPAVDPAATPAATPAKIHELPDRIARTGADIVEIKEKLFIAQTNDVYLNPEDYLGKTIKLEGLFKSEIGDEASYCFVIRYGPGCCGYDGNAGFEVAWNNPGPGAGGFPEEDSWVEAVGVLDSYDENGYPYLYLSLASLAVKEPRGAEFVSQ